MPKKCAFVDEEGVRCQEPSRYKFKFDDKDDRCNSHKLIGMVRNSKYDLCNYEDCETIANFNIAGSTNGMYCFAHKSVDMIDINVKRCIHDGCDKRALFNKREEPARFCSVHRTEYMIDVISRKCKETDCIKQPCYNFSDKTKPVYCIDHKIIGMIDLKNPRCIHIDVNNIRCNIRPYYNNYGETKPLFCLKHKSDTMINIVSKSCRGELCNTLVRNKYEGYCLRCFIHAHPDKPVSRNYKTKERCVVEYITSHFPDFSWVADKTMTDGCSRRRPDLTLDLGYQVIILEIDENQHVDYDCSCENKRVMQLSQDVSHRPLIMIRFNPDEYTDANGENVSSCWGMNKLGLCVVKKSKEKEWESRLERLREQVEYWTNPDNATEKTVEIVELFYDCD